MHPSVHSKTPGKCPICSMDLVPVTKRGGGDAKSQASPQMQNVKGGGEMKDMPVVFWIDKDLPKDIKTITLAYTLFDVG